MVVILTDTTYWGRGFGVMLFKDSLTGRNLLKYYVKYETNALYRRFIEELRAKGFEVLAIVCDGRRGLIQSFVNMPVQMCQFHQAAILRRYLTKRPKLQAAQEMLEISDLMKKTDKESFTGALNAWFAKWACFLEERSTNPITKKTYYTHKRLRCAARSLRQKLPWLFTWYDYPGLRIPNTTNAIDGHFADLKNKLRNHNGLSEKRKFIDEFLKAKRPPKISEGWAGSHNPLNDILVGRPFYPWHVALQQSTLPFQQARQRNSWKGRNDQK